MEIEYDFHELESDDWLGIKILNGQFKDVIYHYGVVSFQDKKDEPTLKFDYKIVESPFEIDEDDDTIGEFIQVLGDILVDIVEKEPTVDDS